jgi:hypothetical protein
MSLQLQGFLQFVPGIGSRELEGKAVEGGIGFGGLTVRNYSFNKSFAMDVKKTLSYISVQQARYFYECSGTRALRQHYQDREARHMPIAPMEHSKQKTMKNGHVNYGYFSLV